MYSFCYVSFQNNDNDVVGCFTGRLDGVTAAIQRPRK